MRSAIVCLPCALALAACDSRAPEPRQAEAVAEPAPIEAGPRATLLIDDRGAAMPDVTFEGPDGTSATLADFRGKPVLVNLWATWCGPCVKEMPTLDALARRTEGRLEVLTVAQDFQGATKVDPWWAERDFAKLEPWLDPANGLGQHYKTGMLPTTVLYDAQGREVWRVVGEMDWDGARANTLLAEVLG